MLIRKRLSLQGSCEQLRLRIESLTEENSRLSETVARQRLQYDQLKLKVATFRQQAQSEGFESLISTDGLSQAWRAPTEEEIELELLQRKETLKERGAT
jgi:predicted nuclease with TOPRIM domain